MWSLSRSAFEPSSVMVFPFTVTRPSTINSSALRRLVTPACDRIFCRRSSGIFRGGLRRFERKFRLGRLRPVLRLTNRHASQFLEFLQRRQLAQVLQPELH